MVISIIIARRFGDEDEEELVTADIVMLVHKRPEKMLYLSSSLEFTNQNLRPVSYTLRPPLHWNEHIKAI